MNEPKRIQRQRTKGWRMPENTVYVGRPTWYGNIYTVKAMEGDRTRAVANFRLWMEFLFANEHTRDGALRKLEALRGKDLACWCPLDQPCHADVLLEWANEERDR